MARHTRVEELHAHHSRELALGRLEVEEATGGRDRTPQPGSAVPPDRPRQGGGE